MTAMPATSTSHRGGHPGRAPAPGALTARRRDYERIADSLAWLAAHFEEQPTLAETAAQAGLSAYHFQRLFSRWVGLSPKKYVQYLTLERAKQCLATSGSVLDAAYAAGLSGPGRLHDLFVSVEAVTPGEYRHRGAGLDIGYGVHDSPFGRCLIMHTARGVCGLAFLEEDDAHDTLAELSGRFARARIREDRATGAALAARIFDRAAGEPLRLLLAGTPFQIKVWEALLSIPAGTVTTYRALAERVGSPGAARAVGQAVGANPIGYLIPCHRVIRHSGALGGYRWGPGRKLAMLSAELTR
ncbi:MAG: methylated-DNA--[protein]-cysteine S-methyltransferase [Gammaproteobacteria bacterium]|nr:methylated-DNA--[protein]-cysteine S-methyltransferase [Gammaproteobacteria bacterium]